SHELAYNPGRVGQLTWTGVYHVRRLFAGWPYLLLCAAVSVAGLWGRPFPVFTCAISLSGLSYGLEYFFVSPGCDYRLSCWPALGGGLGLVTFFIERRASQSRGAIPSGEAAGEPLHVPDTGSAA